MGVINVYCDGGCRGNQNKENIGGWGVLLEYNGHKKEFYGNEIDTTNNKMELKSCIEALKAINDRSKTTVVTMDSQYVVKGITEWIHGWVKKGWKTAKNKPVENKELWVELYELAKTFNDIGFVHCYGHGDNEGNNRADELANMAMDEF